MLTILLIPDKLLVNLSPLLLVLCRTSCQQDDDDIMIAAAADETTRMWKAVALLV